MYDFPESEVKYLIPFAHNITDAYQRFYRHALTNTYYETNLITWITAGYYKLKGNRSFDIINMLNVVDDERIIKSLDRVFYSNGVDSSYVSCGRNGFCVCCKRSVEMIMNA